MPQPASEFFECCASMLIRTHDSFFPDLVKLADGRSVKIAMLIDREFVLKLRGLGSTVPSPSHYARGLLPELPPLDLKSMHRFSIF